MSVNIQVSRFTDSFNPMESGVWNGLVITPEQVETAIRIRNFERKPVPVDGTVRQHIGRIAYFVKKGWKDPIHIDVGVPGHTPWGHWIITDGNHRLSAAIVAGHETIACEVSGSVALAKELFGVEI